MDKLKEKLKKVPNFKPDPEFDKITAENNIKLYDIFVEKLEHTIYSKRPSSPINILKSGRALFLELSIIEQADVLLNIMGAFNRVSGSEGCDLTAIGGKKQSGKPTVGNVVSNWKKNYKDVRLIDESPSGLWVKKSENLLDLI